MSEKQVTFEGIKSVTITLEETTQTRTGCVPIDPVEEYANARYKERVKELEEENAKLKRAVEAKDWASNSCILVSGNALLVTAAQDCERLKRRVGELEVELGTVKAERDSARAELRDEQARARKLEARLEKANASLNGDA